MTPPLKIKTRRRELDDAKGRALANANALGLALARERALAEAVAALLETVDLSLPSCGEPHDLCDCSIHIGKRALAASRFATIYAPASSTKPGGEG